MTLRLEAIRDELQRAENIIIGLRHNVEATLDRQRRMFSLTTKFENGEISQATYLAKHREITKEDQLCCQKKSKRN